MGLYPDSKLGDRMPTDEPSVYKKLRDKAEAQLLSGTTPTAGQWSMGVDALRLLHRLSSDPNKAEDALKLLHELQVHQVELDLQNEEISANERVIAEDLCLYRTLYDCAPLAYCIVDVEGMVIQANLAAAELFGVAQDHLEGHRIDRFLNQKSRPQFLGLLQSAMQSGVRNSCVAERVGGAQGSRHVQFLASTPPKREHILLACCECGNVE